MTDNGQTEKIEGQPSVLSDSELAAAQEKASVSLPIPEAGPPPTNFPPLLRRFFDVFHDDERNEVWVGIKLRTSVKGQTREGGPVEDIEVNLDGVSIITALDAAKQEALVVLMRDQQALNEKRQRQAALKSNGVLGRLTDGLGRALSAGKKILSH